MLKLGVLLRKVFGELLIISVNLCLIDIVIILFYLRRLLFLRFFIRHFRFLRHGIGGGSSALFITDRQILVDLRILIFFGSLSFVWSNDIGHYFLF